MTNYENIAMDYGAPAFVIEDPGTDEPAVEDYKPPTAARQGFTKDIEEDGDVLVCCACEDELAAADDEVKQQVWVVKKCGHVSIPESPLMMVNTDFLQVYCGACASRRFVTRGGNERDRRRAKTPKTEDLRTCRVEGCAQKLTAKTAMFQVYL